MRMDEIRTSIYAIAERIGGQDAETLRALADATKRRLPIRKAEPQSQPMTPELARQIRAYRKTHPNASHQQIAINFGVNPGRVSEALRGKRT